MLHFFEVVMEGIFILVSHIVLMTSATALVCSALYIALGIIVVPIEIYLAWKEEDINEILKVCKRYVKGILVLLISMIVCYVCYVCMEYFNVSVW